jgi:PTH1 family peptidyl-tRNA hydrolase
MWLVVGLGNPGAEYARTRHNVGFETVDELARRGNAPAWRGKFGAEVTEIQLAGARTALCKPMQFMNVSGQAVASAAGFWKIPGDRVIVVHDDLDLPFGRLKLNAGGGHGGHNGLRSIIASAVGPDFLRVRVGIGRPPAGQDPAAYVLAQFTKVEQKHVPSLAGEASLAVETIAILGIEAAMNRFNSKKKP